MSVVRKLVLGLLVCAAASAQAATQSVAATTQTTQASAPAAPAATSSSSTASTPAASSSTTSGNQATTATTTTTKSTSSTASSSTTQLVNINTADEATLAKVRGVGSANAKAIVAYRDNATTPHQFTSVYDLAKVPGVTISARELKILATKRLSVS